MAAAISALLAVIVAAPTGSAGGSCEKTERGLARALESAQVEKEPEGTVKMVFEDATRSLATCPGREGLAYLRVRSAELGRGVLVGDLPPGGLGALRELTNGAAAQFPDSPRILTVAARVTRDPGLARRALAANPAYLPARVALADMLADAGDWPGAEKVLPDARGLDATSDGLVVLSRVQLANGNAAAALATATQALTRRRLDLVEPDAGDPRPLRRAQAVAASAKETLRAQRKKTRH